MHVRMCKCMYDRTADFSRDWTVTRLMYVCMYVCMLWGGCMYYKQLHFALEWPMYTCRYTHTFQFRLLSTIHLHMYTHTYMYTHIHTYKSCLLQFGFQIHHTYHEIYIYIYTHTYTHTFNSRLLEFQIYHTYHDIYIYIYIYILYTHIYIHRHTHI